MYFLSSSFYHYLGLTNLIYLTFSWKQGLPVTQLPEDTPHRPHVHCLSIGSPEMDRERERHKILFMWRMSMTTLSNRWQWWWWKMRMIGRKMKSPKQRDCENDGDGCCVSKKMVISEGMELRSLVKNGERSGSREAEERWCWRERVFEWAAFKRCLNKCSRAFTKSGYSS